MLTCHWTVGAGDPLAVAVKEANVPGVTPRSRGFVVTVGAAGYHTTARATPAAVKALPTITPALFTALAWLAVPPSVPRSTVAVPIFAANAWLTKSPARKLEPTISPESLTSSASFSVPPSVLTLTIPDVAVQEKAAFALTANACSM